MRPMPKAAMPVWKAIKKQVKRPVNPIIVDSVLRWPNKFVGENVKYRHLPCCPMGMLKSANYPTPITNEGFIRDEFTAKQITAYAGWFDKLCAADIPAFMDFQWPRKKAVKRAR